MYIKVHVHVEAKVEIFRKITEDSFEISVKEKAVMNRANKRVVEILRRELQVVKGEIRIVSGHHSPGKIISIEKSIG